MKKLLIFLSALLAVVPVIVIGCTKNVESTRSSVDSVRDFYQNGVHITISDGCPMTTKYSSFDGALTITGEDGDISYTLYAVEINEDNNFSSYDVFSESGTKIGTYVYCNNILVNFEISADLDSPQNTVTTKAKEEGEKYSDCVKGSQEHERQAR